MAILTTEAKQKLATYKDKFLAIHPNNEKDSEGKSLYTDAEWLDEYVKRMLIIQLKRGERILQQQSLQSTKFSLE